jgi:hypothetical protein
MEQKCISHEHRGGRPAISRQWFFWRTPWIFIISLLRSSLIMMWTHLIPTLVPGHEKFVQSVGIISDWYFSSNSRVSTSLVHNVLQIQAKFLNPSIGVEIIVIAYIIHMSRNVDIAWTIHLNFSQNFKIYFFFDFCFVLYNISTSLKMVKWGANLLFCKTFVFFC